MKTTIEYSLLEPQAMIFHNHDPDKLPNHDRKQYIESLRLEMPEQPEILMLSTIFGNVKIKLGDFCFSRRRATKDFVSWSCVERNCQASCTTTHDFELLTWDDEIAHRHDKVSLLTIAKNEIKFGAKRKAVENPNEKPAKVICSVLKGVEKIMSDKDLVNLRKSKIQYLFFNFLDYQLVLPVREMKIKSRGACVI